MSTPDSDPSAQRLEPAWGTEVVLAAGTNVDPEDVVEDVAADAVDDGADVALVVADETLVLVDERPDAE